LWSRFPAAPAGARAIMDLMPTTPGDWEDRLAALWARVDALPETEFIAAMDALVAELPPGSAVGAYERGSAFDSTGHSDRAVPLYREALGAGLPPDRRRQAVIQLASSLRNLGEPEEGVALLRRELDAESDDLDDGVRAFLALCLVDVGGEREAVALTLEALAGHLPRYARSVRNYAHDLIDPGPA
jgi:tetratricopeptide (TPR) repeat protein